MTSAHRDEICDLLCKNEAANGCTMGIRHWPTSTCYLAKYGVTQATPQFTHTGCYDDEYIVHSWNDVYDTTCGEALTGATGSLVWPNNGCTYYESIHWKDCTWTITVAAGSTIRLTVNTFDVYFNDRLIIDGVYYSVYSINILDWNNPPPTTIDIASNTVTIRLTMDQYSQTRGFFDIGWQQSE